MVEQLTLQPNQRYRECGCPTWVLRCAHWEGRTLMMHDFQGAQVFICITDKLLDQAHDEVGHGGLVLLTGDREAWSAYEADFLAGNL